MKKHFMDRQRSDNKASSVRGFAVLFSVIVMGAIGAIISVMLLNQSVQSNKDSLAILHAAQAQRIADACAEYALNELRASPSYDGNETIAIGSQNCSVLPMEGSGQVRTIKTQSTVGSSTRRVRIITSRMAPSIVLSEWREVADF